MLNPSSINCCKIKQEKRKRIKQEKARKDDGRTGLYLLRKFTPSVLMYNFCLAFAFLNAYSSLYDDPNPRKGPLCFKTFGFFMNYPHLQI